MQIYVGSLPFSMSEGELRGLFEPYGPVKSAKIIIDRESGRSKGFGFVEMDNDEEAKKAIGELEGKDVNGRALKVNQAREAAPRPPREGGFRPREGAPSRDGGGFRPRSNHSSGGRGGYGDRPARRS